MKIPTILRGQTVSLAVLGSREYIDATIASGKRAIIIPKIPKAVVVIFETSQPHSAASLMFRFPSAWPTRVAADKPIAMLGSIAASIKLMSTFAAATSGVPILPIIQKVARKPVEKKSCWRPLGRDSFTNVKISGIFGSLLRNPNPPASLFAL